MLGHWDLDLLRQVGSKSKWKTCLAATLTERAIQTKAAGDLRVIAYIEKILLWKTGTMLISLDVTHLYNYVA